MSFISYNDKHGARARQNARLCFADRVRIAPPPPEADLALADSLSLHRPMRIQGHEDSGCESYAKAQPRVHFGLIFCYFFIKEKVNEIIILLVAVISTERAEAFAKALREKSHQEIHYRKSMPV